MKVIGIAGILSLVLVLTLPHYSSSSPTSLKDLEGKLAFLSKELESLQEDYETTDDEAPADEEKTAEAAPVQPEWVAPNACVNEVYIFAYTSNVWFAGSDCRQYFELCTKWDNCSTIRLPDRRGNDYMPNKGDLWEIDLNTDLGFDECVLHEDIASVTIKAGGSDGWNIGTIVTVTKRNSHNGQVGDHYTVLSWDYGVQRWVETDEGDYRKRFELTLVN